MKSSKTIDCIALKNQIQAQLWEKRKQFGEAEMQRRHREWLEHSDDPLAVWWRSLKPQSNIRAI